MQTLLHQDWTTITCTGAGSITQSERDYADLYAFEGFVAWVDIRDLGGTTLTLFLETAPAKDEVLFSPSNMSQTALTGPVGTTGDFVVTNLINNPQASQAPLARWLRWRISGAASWTLTFRIVLALHAGPA